MLDDRDFSLVLSEAAEPAEPMNLSRAARNRAMRAAAINARGHPSRRVP